MKKTLTYKGFTGTVEREDDGTLGGELLNIYGDSIYDGEDMTELERKFRESVDEYIQYCEMNGWDPFNAPHPAKAKVAGE